MSKDRVELVTEHMVQFTEMLESAECDFESYALDDLYQVVEVDGLLFVFNNNDGSLDHVGE